MKKAKTQKGLSLERFAHAKTTSYDKKKAKEKEFALNAKKVNKYRKLKERLAKEGKLAPLAGSIVQDDVDEEAPALKAPRQNRDSSPHSHAQGGKAAPEMDRIRSRAGPAPDCSDEEGDMSDDSDMIGDESDEDVDAAAAQRTGSERPSGRQAAYHQTQQTGTDQVIARAAGAEQRGSTAAGPVRGQQSAARQLQPSAHDQERSQNPASTSGAGHLHLEGTAEPKTLHGKAHRKKPLSRMQRIAAEVQARKEAEAKAREARKAEMETHKARVAAAEKQRKQQTKLLRKRTRHGQPVMRYRMDKLLGQLQAEAQHS